VTALIAPARHRRAALVAGGVLGTLPDLDVIPITLSGADAVTRITWHRGPSHSLLLLALTGWLLWLVLRRSWAPVKEEPTRWLWAIESALLTHPLLDAFTAYGAQLFWPLPGSPVIGASIFIIDPAHTVPLLVAWAPLGGCESGGRRICGLLAGVLLSTATWVGR
jgi:inner membrane protein